MRRGRRNIRKRHGITYVRSLRELYQRACNSFGLQAAGIVSNPNPLYIKDYGMGGNDIMSDTW